MASARPIPEPAPVISVRLPSSCMALDGMPRRQLVVDVAVEAVEHLRRIDHDLLDIGIGDAIHERLEECDVLDVERSMRPEIREAILAATAERALDGRRQPCRRASVDIPSRTCTLPSMA